MFQDLRGQGVKGEAPSALLIFEVVMLEGLGVEFIEANCFGLSCRKPQVRLQGIELAGTIPFHQDANACANDFAQV
jgi:hypothetical protein